jgi:hypothetical protein
MPPEGGILVRILFLGVLALLVSDAAAGLASRLARGLALTATAVLCALAKVASFNGLNMLHNGKPPNKEFTSYIVAYFFAKVNIKPDIFPDFCNFFRGYTWQKGKNVVY